MHAFSSEHRRSLLTGHSVVRLLIVSYFLALSLGVIEGTDISVLTGPFLADWVSRGLTSLFVLGLCAMILIGWHRQAAALVLALAMFWASYLAMMAAPDEHLGAFWRDLALIGALVLTYADGNKPKSASHAALNDRQDGRRRTRISQALATTRSVISRPSARGAAPQEGEQAELFRKDLDIVRAS